MNVRECVAVLVASLLTAASGSSGVTLPLPWRYRRGGLTLGSLR